MPLDALLIALAVVVVVGGVVALLLWKRPRRASKAIVVGRRAFPSSGLLVPDGVVPAGSSTSDAIWDALKSAASPVALEYRPVTTTELSKFRTVRVNASLQQALVEVVKTLNPRNPTLFRVVLPQGAELVRAVGTDGFRGFARNANGIAAHAVLKPIAVGGAIAAGWPVFAIAGTVLVMDMVAQREVRAHQRRVESLLHRHEERYYIERVKDQRTTDKQLSRAISMMLDGQNSPLELALKGADDEFHRAQQFLDKYGALLVDLTATKGKVDFRRLEEALGGKTKDTDYFVRELQLARVAIALRRKALIADAAAGALADPTNPYLALRTFLESQASQLEAADTALTELTEQLTEIEYKRRWQDAVTGLWHGPDKSVVARQVRLRAQIAPAVVPVESEPELRFVATPSGEILQVLPPDDEDVAQQKPAPRRARLT